MLAAASAWDGLAAELSSAATGYSSVIDELTSSPWLGPASQTMMAAVAPYVSWISASAGQAEEAASQARAAAAAYETAFMMTVPPPVIAANRVLLMTLIATNFFGQNTAAIAATEAQYMEMWAQDAAAMYGYAGSSAIATELAKFVDPPNTTTPGAAGGQSAAVGQATATPAGNSAQTVASTIPQLLSSAATPQALQPLASSTASTPNLPWPLSLVYNTIYDLFTEGLPTPTNNWLGLASSQYTAILKQTTGLAYFSNGLGQFGSQIGQQLFNGLGTTAGSAAAPGSRHRPLPLWAPVAGLCALRGWGSGGAHRLGHQSRGAVGAVELGRRAGLAGRRVRGRHEVGGRQPGQRVGGRSEGNERRAGRCPVGRVARRPTRGQLGCPIWVPLQRACPATVRRIRPCPLSATKSRRFVEPEGY